MNKRISRKKLVEVMNRLEKVHGDRLPFFLFCGCDTVIVDKTTGEDLARGNRDCWVYIGNFISSIIKNVGK